jgi:hypothetical protein
MFAGPTQEGNVVGGHLAARDVVTNYNYGPALPSQIQRLYESLKGEANKSAQALEIIEQLQHFMGKPPSQASRTLAEKLQVTDRADLIETAEMAKERAAKKIMRFQTSAAAQEIFAYVLGELHTKYLLHIRPLIAAGATRVEIDSAMEEKVINPVAVTMEPSALGLTPDLVIAMLFYLAGNCHVRWD